MITYKQFINTYYLIRHTKDKYFGEVLLMKHKENQQNYIVKLEKLETEKELDERLAA